MLEKIKKNPVKTAYISIFAILLILLASLMSLYILQSDDYYYSLFFKDGFLNFINLTLDHFQNFNGRAFVHLFAHIALALPKGLTVALNFCVLFFSSYFFVKANKEKVTNPLFFNIVFFALILLLGGKVLRESVMWVSAFYNYIFPLLSVSLMLYFKDKSIYIFSLFAFLSGATTEQWGFSVICMLLFSSLCSLNKKKDVKEIFLHFLPLAFSLLGYVSIYLSPATLSRIKLSAHTAPTSLLFDFSRLAELFFNEGSCVLVIAAFIIVALLAAFILKKSYTLLYFGFVPLGLMLFSSLHPLSLCALIIHIVLCIVAFCRERLFTLSILLTGALSAIIIMLPSNTFEYRITVPFVLLVILCTATLLFEFDFPDRVTLPTSIALLLVVISVFAPSYMGFYNNYLIEKQNLAQIREAKSTKEINYSIDYDKNYAMRQMFNDGWFYKNFLKFYNIEDCLISITSKDAKDIYIDEEKLNIDALLYQGEYYAPMRKLLTKLGGEITVGDDVVMRLGDYSLSYIDSAFVYFDENNNPCYITADENKLPDFYTLYVKLEVIEDAFNLNIKAL